MIDFRVILKFLDEWQSENFSSSKVINGAVCIMGKLLGQFMSGDCAS